MIARLHPVHVSVPLFWNALPARSFKLNVDGAAKGNPGPAGYGGVIRNLKGSILSLFWGSIGSNMNNMAEMEGLIQVFKVLIRGCYFPAIIEGDSKIPTQMAKHLANGKDCAKVAMSWCLASRLDSLKTMLHVHSYITFNHVRCSANKATNILANAGVVGDTGLRYGILEEFNVEEWA